MRILVTGVAGFIGFHLARRLLLEGHEVVGIDNLNHYYDVRLKLDRLAELGIDPYQIAIAKPVGDSAAENFKFIKMDLKEEVLLFRLFETIQFEIVYNMAAQAGVRHSIENPKAYVDSNLVGFANILEACRRSPVDHLIYASSSSVYGNSATVPFKTSDKVDEPISFYAATKKSNELMAHSYNHLYNIPMTGLRFFTVYGEWGRPDMAPMLFAKAILNEKVIKVFNHGIMSRDFTYVGDIVEGMIKIMNKNSQKRSERDNGTNNYNLFNIGANRPIKLLEFIELMEEAFQKKAIKEMHPMQPGDVESTYADVSELIKHYNYSPQTNLTTGLKNFAKWYLDYYPGV